MRKFGIELEMVAPLRFDAAASLQALGLTASNASYSGRQYDRWQIKPDGSIRAGNLTHGIEVVSPVLDADASSYETVMRVCAMLDQSGCTVNRSTGYHVHISLADLTAKERLAVVLRFAMIQDDINAILPASRRAGNSYIRPFGAAHMTELALRASTGAPWVAQGRYWNLNMTYLFTHGRNTLEFRQAAGTVNGRKVVGWVKFLQETIDEALRRFRAGRPARASRRAATAGGVPSLRAGTLPHFIVTRLAANGQFTAADLAERGAPESQLRAQVSALRARGLQVRTIGINGVFYSAMMEGETPAPRAIEALFTQAAPAAEAAPAEAAPAAGPSDVRAILRYGMEDGLTAETIEWVRERRAVFAEDVQP